MDTMKLGREMMTVSGDLKDDTESCNWARIGQILTQLGNPRMPRSVMDMTAKDRAIIADAIKSLQEKSNPAA